VVGVVDAEGDVGVVAHTDIVAKRPSRPNGDPSAGPRCRPKEAIRQEFGKIVFAACRLCVG
jgi:hypothetical protein